jgi:HAMP domain-containing protein
MNQMQQNPLAGLKDIHLPPAPDWWPPACGWWLLAALFLSLIIFGLVKWFRHQDRLRPIKLAVKELKSMDLQTADPEQRRLTLQQLSGLIRRFALVFFPQEQTAEFCGREWLDFICAHSYTMSETEAEKAFSPLIQDPYAPVCSTDLITLGKNLEQWFNGLKKKKPATGDKP